MTLVPLTETGPDVYVPIITIFISNYYYALEYTITHMKSIKIKSYPGYNVTYLYSMILIDDEHLEDYV